ncbi:S8 family serine peptidase [Streptomyces sp. NPDC005795]|uniref:S8 family serine peptidase n=1 Tax=Streptomyces sp. NPDC005795 TaxID=3154677 RepID=UPI0033CAD59D
MSEGGVAAPLEGGTAAHAGSRSRSRTRCRGSARPEAWAEGFDGKGVTAEALDSGIAPAHPDAKGSIVGTKSSVPGRSAGRNGHGAHAASAVAGSGTVSDGVCKGVTPAADLLVGKAATRRTPGSARPGSRPGPGAAGVFRLPPGPQEPPRGTATEASRPNARIASAPARGPGARRRKA